MKLSRFFSIMFLSALVTVLVGGVFVVKVGALEATPIPDENESAMVTVEDVPEVGSFGDVWMRWRERFSLWVAVTDEDKLALEEKYANRRVAQLEKLEALPDDYPNKEEMIAKLEERHEQMVVRMEARAEKLGSVREKVWERIDEQRAEFEARKERVLEKANQRKEKTSDLKERVEQKKQEIRTRTEEKKGELEGRVMENRERVESRVRGDIEEVGKVQGAVDYQPSNLLERVGYMIQGL